MVTAFRHSSAKQVTPPSSLGRIPYDVKPKTNSRAAGSAPAPPQQPRPHTEPRPLLGPGHEALDGLSSIGQQACLKDQRLPQFQVRRKFHRGLLPSLDLLRRCGFYEPVAQDPHADRRVGPVQKMEQRSVPEQVEIVGGGPVLRRHGDPRLGQRHPIAAQTGDRLLVDLSQQAIALQLAADVLVILTAAAKPPSAMPAPKYHSRACSLRQPKANAIAAATKVATRRFITTRSRLAYHRSAAENCSTRRWYKLSIRMLSESILEFVSP